MRNQYLDFIRMQQLMDSDGPLARLFNNAHQSYIGQLAMTDRQIMEGDNSGQIESPIQPPIGPQIDPAQAEQPTNPQSARAPMTPTPPDAGSSIDDDSDYMATLGGPQPIDTGPAEQLPNVSEPSSTHPGAPQTFEAAVAAEVAPPEMQQMGSIQTFGGLPGEVEESIAEFFAYKDHLSAVQKAFPKADITELSGLDIEQIKKQGIERYLSNIKFSTEKGLIETTSPVEFLVTGQVVTAKLAGTAGLALFAATAPAEMAALIGFEEVAEDNPVAGIAGEVAFGLITGYAAEKIFQRSPTLAKAIGLKIKEKVTDDVKNEMIQRVVNTRLEGKIPEIPPDAGGGGGRKPAYFASTGQRNAIYPEATTIDIGPILTTTKVAERQIAAATVQLENKVNIGDLRDAEVRAIYKEAISEAKQNPIITDEESILLKQLENQVEEAEKKATVYDSKPDTPAFETANVYDDRDMQEVRASVALEWYGPPFEENRARKAIAARIKRQNPNASKTKLETLINEEYLAMKNSGHLGQLFREDVKASYEQALEELAKKKVNVDRDKLLAEIEQEIQAQYKAGIEKEAKARYDQLNQQAMLGTKRGYVRGGAEDRTDARFLVPPGKIISTMGPDGKVRYDFIDWDIHHNLVYDHEVNNLVYKSSPTPITPRKAEPTLFALGEIKTLQQAQAAIEQFINKALDPKHIQKDKKGFKVYKPADALKVDSWYYSSKQGKTLPMRRLPDKEIENIAKLFGWSDSMVRSSSYSPNTNIFKDTGFVNIDNGTVLPNPATKQVDKAAERFYKNIDKFPEKPGSYEIRVGKPGLQKIDNPVRVGEENEIFHTNVFDKNGKEIPNMIMPVRIAREHSTDEITIFKEAHQQTDGVFKVLIERISKEEFDKRLRTRTGLPDILHATTSPEDIISNARKFNEWEITNPGYLRRQADLPPSERHPRYTPLNSAKLEYSGQMEAFLREKLGFPPKLKDANFYLYYRRLDQLAVMRNAFMREIQNLEGTPYELQAKKMFALWRDRVTGSNTLEELNNLNRTRARMQGYMEARAYQQQNINPADVEDAIDKIAERYGITDDVAAQIYRSRMESHTKNSQDAEDTIVELMEEHNLDYDSARAMYEEEMEKFDSLAEEQNEAITRWAEEAGDDEVGVPRTQAARAEDQAGTAMSGDIIDMGQKPSLNLREVLSSDVAAIGKQVNVIENHFGVRFKDRIWYPSDKGGSGRVNIFKINSENDIAGLIRKSVKLNKESMPINIPMHLGVSPAQGTSIGQAQALARIILDTQNQLGAVAEQLVKHPDDLLTAIAFDKLQYLNRALIAQLTRGEMPQETLARFMKYDMLADSDFTLTEQLIKTIDDNYAFFGPGNADIRESVAWAQMYLDLPDAQTRIRTLDQWDRARVYQGLETEHINNIAARKQLTKILEDSCGVSGKTP